MTTVERVRRRPTNSADSSSNVGPGTCLQEADMAHSMLVSSMKSNNMGKCVTEKMLARANDAEKTACEVSRGIEVMLVWQKGDRK
ncbi:uncharacterized protein PADG_05963 [Paracoccidioides brasiliensis Pb18]|uniref:Uncharacterized protein n=1 Tax=Paracoccidioides brasiliensis (strain Pb18) TaxID=502780 RepID=C1GFC7_PARBD|nr:uncharacterized protein PADG_05963 [Paracoccidioides brasiliensis Pb18]EEH49884.2 hypothetical protein PADG_05963 [Paracoccidioides brasiliensis Pb18]